MFSWAIFCAFQISEPVAKDECTVGIISGRCANHEFLCFHSTTFFKNWQINRRKVDILKSYVVLLPSAAGFSCFLWFFQPCHIPIFLGPSPCFSWLCPSQNFLCIFRHWLSHCCLCIGIFVWGATVFRWLGIVLFFFACSPSPLVLISVPSSGIDMNYRRLLIFCAFHRAEVCRYRKNLRFFFAITRARWHGFRGLQWSWVLPDMLHFRKFVSDPIILVIRAGGFLISGLTFLLCCFPI